MPLPKEVTPQWANYLDLTGDVKPWLGLPQTSDQPDVRLQLTIDAACQWVQNFLGRPVGPTEFFRYLSGWAGNGGSVLMLPYYPILEVKKVVEWWGISGPHELIEQTPAKQGGGEMFQVDPLKGHITRSFQGLVRRPFFPGEKNIEVTWVAGYNPVPADIKIATQELIQYWWRNSQQPTRTQTLPGSNFNDAGSAGLWPGIPNRIREWLAPYIQQGLG